MENTSKTDGLLFPLINDSRLENSHPCIFQIYPAALWHNNFSNFFIIIIIMRFNGWVEKGVMGFIQFSDCDLHLPLVIGGCVWPNWLTQLPLFFYLKKKKEVFQGI